MDKKKTHSAEEGNYTDCRLTSATHKAKRVSKYETWNLNCKRLSYVHSYILHTLNKTTVETEIDASYRQKW